MLNRHSLCMNEGSKNTMTIDNPYPRKVYVCTLIQCFLQFYFQYVLNVPSMKDFHPKEPQEILYRMLFLFLDC